MICPDVVDILKNAHHVCILTGAGISAESGVPTFRDAQTGLWARYDPTDLATPEAFAKDPLLVWEWYAWRRDLIKRVEPNSGHLALAALSTYWPLMTLVTQNVDNLHQQAGSHGVIELHGNIFRIKRSDGTPIEDWDEKVKPPRCPTTGQLLRPDVVWFGEQLPIDALSKAEDAASNCDIFLSIGTSTLVYPAAGLPWRALQQGATVIEINPHPTPLSEVAHKVITGPSGQVLAALQQILSSTPF